MGFVFLVLLFVLSALLGFLRYRYTYWQQRSMPQLKTHFLFGNIFSLKSLSWVELLEEVYENFKGKAKIAGAYVFTQPIAVVVDLDLAKTILIRDFNKFVDRTDYMNYEKEPLSGNLFNLRGEKWRAMRTKLTSTFTSGKMKNMFPLIVNVAKEFEEVVMCEAERGVDIEVHDLMARFTTDVIGTCAFGIECNSLKNPDTDFRNISRRMFRPTKGSIKYKIFAQVYKNTLKKLGFRMFSKTSESFFMRVVRETTETRQRENIKRNDFLNMLIEMKKDVDGGLSLEEMAAQVFIFFVAGFETSSSNLSYGLFELARNPAVQDKARQEILDVLEKHNGVLTYEAMLEMTYLDQIITETLRMYPALASLIRYANVDYAVPGTNITLEAGSRVHIPARAIHYDADIYENPKVFDPERFSEAAVKLRHPQAFLGFGDGPRNCIGLRFGRMQVRVALITLLKSFRFSLSSQSPEELTISKSNLILMPETGVWVKVNKLR